jgi:2-keto-4-pentenoate hydratase/2-oxohepta-3-ene-1,7-dioic acid hydratase in catechol pathway
MKLVSFLHGGRTEHSRIHAGLLVDTHGDVVDLAAALGEAPADPLAWLDLDAGWVDRARAIDEAVRGGSVSLRSGALVRRTDVRLVAPVPRPGKVVCIGLNYRDHAAESGAQIPSRPVVFSKFPTSVVGPDDAVLLPSSSEQVDYEAELAVVIGRRAKRVPRARALEYVLGYTNFNDVSARDFQFGDGQWQRGKSCDTFAPTGPFIATPDEIPDPHALAIRFRLNGTTLQDSSTSQLIFGVAELIEFVSETITLEPGDLIATGTPPGVGFARKPPVFIKPGDVLEVEIDGLGVLRNTAVAEVETATE